MKADKKVYVKRALIVFPIILVLVGTIILGAFSPLFMGNNNIDQANANGESSEQLALEDVITDDKALKIIDIHENLEDYLDKDVVLEGYFIEFDENNSVFGVEVPLGEGNITMASLAYKLKDENTLEDIKETDLIKASGTISSFDQVHEEDDEEDHIHTLPQFNVEKIEVIR